MANCAIIYFEPGCGYLLLDWKYDEIEREGRETGFDCSIDGFRQCLYVGGWGAGFGGDFEVALKSW